MRPITRFERVAQGGVSGFTHLREPGADHPICGTTPGTSWDLVTEPRRLTDCDYCNERKYTMTGDLSEMSYYDFARTIGKNRFPLPERYSTSACRKCGAPMVWIRTSNDKPLPLTLADLVTYDGQQWAHPHFVDCPNANDFRKGGAQKS